jgi:hypothetical protein
VLQLVGPVLLFVPFEPNAHSPIVPTRPRYTQPRLPHEYSCVQFSQLDDKDPLK